jgi:hypothetical protein
MKGYHSAMNLNLSAFYFFAFPDQNHQNHGSWGSELIHCFSFFITGDVTGADFF